MQRIETPGLAHWSYYLEDGGQAVVIDPQLDVRPYTDLARGRQAHIIDVLETHRNEDFVSGSVELAERTGARMWHAENQLDYEYGTAVEHGQRIAFGSYDLEAVPTPGHTHGHMSYLLRESGRPWMLFCGDLLFAGSVGRTDLGGREHAEEYARELYHSLVDMVLLLDDGVILWPAHGAGSACGNAIVSRDFTTIGLEKQLNPMLQLDENAFVARATETSFGLGTPPYFAHMERMNLEGGRLDERFVPPPLAPDHVEELVSQGATVLDTRGTECYVAAHVPDSIGIPSSMLGAWAGWFVDADTPVVLVSDDPYADMLELATLGIDDVRGFVAGGMGGWETAGRDVATTHVLDTPGVCHRLDENAILRILDGRTPAEVDAVAIPDSRHIPLQELPGRMGELAEEDPIVIFCGSGRRSAIAASLLERAGRQTEVVLGGVTGWSSARCPLEERREV